MNVNRIKTTYLCLFLAFLYSVFIVGCTTQLRSRSEISPLLQEIEGKWYWEQDKGQYYGHFVLKEEGDSYIGTLDDEREGTYGDKLMDIEITNNNIKFTRDGKYGIQYWQGKLKKRKGQLKIVNGKWEKKTGSVGTFQAVKKE